MAASVGLGFALEWRGVDLFLITGMISGITGEDFSIGECLFWKTECRFGASGRVSDCPTVSTLSFIRG